MGVHRVGAFCVPTVSGWALGWAGERTPCFGLEREAPALRKGFESLGASREDAGCPSSATMKVKVIPVLEDNYMYLVIEERTREAVAVDVAVPKRGPRAGQRGAGAAAAGAGGAGRGRAHLRADPQAGARRGAAVWGHPRALSPDAGPHLRPHELLPVGRGVSGSARGVLGGCAVGGWLWLAPGEHSSADVREPDRDLGQPASGDEEGRGRHAHSTIHPEEEPVRKFTGKAAPAEVLEALCKERASFQRAAEPVQPQARALLALQWGLLGTPRQK
ncbi:hydroxyacylglutathione hydrolase-like protein isoform X10 [Zalophus californianus]|uniref:Hydroxyacylglutathione hydrolase-like protein isoform X10 n=1 Tax=Zalophus californianus TaxID=9704 RepID=A0A6J2EJT4_ZALCA|nr:hydroxyacylglutathione hydrolase-like protein isoform X10 [Zalophus californianus]